MTAPNLWSDYLAGTDEFSYEEVMFRLQEIYRVLNESPGWGRPLNSTQYDGLDSALNIQSLESTTSPFVNIRTFDDTVKYEGDLTGHDFSGPWAFTGAGTITGNVSITGNVLITGTEHVTGAVTFDSTLHVVGATDLDSTLNVDGAATLQSILHGIGAVDFDSTLNVDGAVTMNAAVTLGDAAADVVTVTGTATFAENVTMTKGLIVDTSTFKVDAASDLVGIHTASPIAKTEVNSMMRISNNTGTPGTGAGLEMYYDSSGGTGTTINSYARTGAAFQPFTVQASVIDLTYQGTSRFKINTTGVGWFATAPVAQQAAPAAVTGTADATYSGNETTLINDLKAFCNAARTTFLNYGLWV